MAFSPSILKLVAKSPFRPLCEHVQAVSSAAAELAVFFDAVLKDDWKKAKKAFDKIIKLEQNADTLKRDLRLYLHKGLFLPVARADILELLAIQDDIANKARDIAGLVYGRKMQLPESCAEMFCQYLSRAIDATDQVAKVVVELGKISESGFGSSGLNLIDNMLPELDAIEQETDVMQIKLREQLFKLEDDLPPVHVMFLYKIMEGVGTIADRAQSVGARSLLLLSR